MKQQRNTVIGLVLLSCAALALIEAVVRPGYVLKSLCKILLFGGSAAFYALRYRRDLLKTLLSRSQLHHALVLAAAVYGGILAGFFLLRPFIDLDSISRALMEKERISAANFLFVALYISLCNSFLEELFFRGLAYLTLREFCSHRFAFGFSALVFALYHIFILHGWFSLWMFALLLLGLFIGGSLFSFLDRKGSLYPSWMVHIAANLAINTVGLIMFGILPL